MKEIKTSSKWVRLLFAAAILFPVLSAHSQFTNDFSIAVIGDSQRLTYGWNGRNVNEQKERFSALTTWLKDHVDSLNIIFITHVGDVVNNEDQPSQWEAATSAMAHIRDAGIPWGIAPGNHDDANNYSYYNTHFGVEWWDTNSWFGGSYPQGESQNQYQIFSYEGNDFLWIHLENQAPSAARNWAQGILDQYPNHTTFVTTHNYTSERGFEPYGETLWNDLITKNENIIAVFCGHQFGVSYVQRENDAGKIVHNILVDYQDENQDSLQGATRWMEINIDSNRVYSHSVNPYEDKAVVDPIRSNSFTGWERDLWLDDPAKAHHENDFVTENFFNPPLTKPVSISKKELIGFRPLENSNWRYFDVKGRSRVVDVDFSSTREIDYKMKSTNVFLVQFKEGGKKILMGYEPVPLE